MIGAAVHGGHRRRVGRETRYEVTPQPLEDAVAWMVEVGAAWDDRLAKLRKSLARGRDAR